MPTGRRSKLDPERRRLRTVYSNLPKNVLAIIASRLPKRNLGSLSTVNKGHRNIVKNTHRNIVIAKILKRLNKIKASEKSYSEYGNNAVLSNANIEKLKKLVSASRTFGPYGSLRLGNRNLFLSYGRTDRKVRDPELQIGKGKKPPARRGKPEAVEYTEEPFFSNVKSHLRLNRGLKRKVISEGPTRFVQARFNNKGRLVNNS